jgi:hypothetical protein
MSAGFLSIADIVADEEDAVFSVSQQYYVSAFTGWTDTSREQETQQHFRQRYKNMLPVSCGMYVADYDVSCDDANVSHPLYLILQSSLSS